MTQVRFVVVAATLLLSSYAGAQTPLAIPTASDMAAAKAATSSIIHPMPANTPAGATLKEANSTVINTPPTTPFRGGGMRYPADLSYQGGLFVGQAQSHAIYITHAAVGCATPSCWGNPEGFLQSLAGSNFIHVTDQYVQRYDDNRYTVGSHISGTWNPYPTVPLTDQNMLAVVHFVASLNNQTGYGHIYHVFLAPGTDECFNASFTVCYSPGKPSTFFFCAYHGSADFQDIGHVLYTVEPYQNVPGCNVPPGSPNGSLVDSTNNVLSHETFETITDPDGDAWWNAESKPIFGSEIGDECSFVIFLSSGVYFDPPAFKIGGKTYAVQSEYSNAGHACATSPEAP